MKREDQRLEAEPKDPHDLARLVRAGSEASPYCRVTQGKEWQREVGRDHR